MYQRWCIPFVYLGQSRAPNGGIRIYYCLYFIFLAPRKGREGYPMRHARRCTQRLYNGIGQPFGIGQLPYSHRVFGLIRYL